MSNVLAGTKVLVHVLGQQVERTHARVVQRLHNDPASTVRKKLVGLQRSVDDIDVHVVQIVAYLSAELFANSTRVACVM